MDADGVRTLIRLGGDSRTELESAVERVRSESVSKAVVALANTKGGHLVYGVEDDGGVTGVADPDALMRLITQTCETSVQPALWCTIEKVAIDDHVVLVVTVPSFGAGRPYRDQKGYFIRDANRSREASRAELLRLLESTDLHYDEHPVGDAAIADLDRDAFLTFAADAYGEGTRNAIAADERV